MAHRWENDENFHIVQEPVQRVKLPTPPNLHKISTRDAKAWLAVWIPQFLGHFPGYKDPLKKPTWWPIEWSVKKNKDKNKEECLMIMAAMYKEYEGMELPFSAMTVQTLPRSDNTTAAVDTGDHSGAHVAQVSGSQQSDVGLPMQSEQQLQFQTAVVIATVCSY